jgi:arginase family enzyme
LVEYASEKGIPGPGQITGTVYERCYTAGNFLFHLLKAGTILPENLFIVGPADGEDCLKETENPRVRDYCSHLELLRNMGVRIISSDQLRQGGATSLATLLREMDCSNLYVSLDVDVCALRGVLATRFMEAEGSPCSTVLERVREVARVISDGRFRLAGLDVMEIDVHRIGAKLPGGHEDQTGDFVKAFLSSFLSTESNSSIHWPKS